MPNKLPKWAKKGLAAPGRLPIVIVDASQAYPAILAELAELVPMEGIAECDPEHPDQYWLECAYQCIKMDLQAALGFGIEIRIHYDADRTYGQKGKKPGRGAVMAAQGKEARDHYIRLRGHVPGSLPG